MLIFRVNYQVMQDTIERQRSVDGCKLWKLNAIMIVVVIIMSACISAQSVVITEEVPVSTITLTKTPTAIFTATNTPTVEPTLTLSISGFDNGFTIIFPVRVKLFM